MNIKHRISAVVRWAQTRDADRAAQREAEAAANPFNQPPQNKTRTISHITTMLG